MSDKVFHINPTDSGVTSVKLDDNPYSMIGCGIILDHATRTVLLRNGDGSDALIPADLLPEDLTTDRGDLDALRVVKHLVELIRKHEKEKLWLAEQAALCNDYHDYCMYYHDCWFGRTGTEECGRKELSQKDFLEAARKAVEKGTQ